MAEQDSVSGDARSNSDLLRDVVNTFSDEAQESAKQTMISAAFKLDRGDVPFDETLINLSQARDVLLYAADNGAIPQLPLRIQRSLINASRNVSTQLVSMTNGADGVIPFVSAVDELTDAVWTSNIQNMTGEVLGLQERLNQLKTLESKLKELQQRAKSFESAESKAKESLDSLSEAVKSGEIAKADLVGKAESGAAALEKLTQAQATALAALASAQQNEKGISDSAANARTASAEISSLKTQSAQVVTELEQSKVGYASLSKEMTEAREQWDAAIRAAHKTQTEAFAAEKSASEAERARLNTLFLEKQTALESSVSTTLSNAISGFTTQSAAQIAASKSNFEAESLRLATDTKTTLGTLENRSQALVKKNEEDIGKRMEVINQLEKVFSEKIRLATNFQLFHSFDTRQKAIAVSVKYWQNALFIAVGTSVSISLIFVGWIIWKSPAYNTTFFLKLSFTVPLVYAIHFCSARFSEERRLEEEYAFKSNISISLEPYRELVERLVNKGDPAEATKYLDFVLSSIDKVFASPTQSAVIARSSDGGVENVKDASQGISKVIGSINDLIQSLGKLK